MNYVNQIQFQPDQAIQWGISILGSGAGNMMSTTMFSRELDRHADLPPFSLHFPLLLYSFFRKNNYTYR